MVSASVKPTICGITPRKPAISIARASSEPRPRQLLEQRLRVSAGPISFGRERTSAARPSVIGCLGQMGFWTHRQASHVGAIAGSVGL
jgi:hypothetical protein